MWFLSPHIQGSDTTDPRRQWPAGGEIGGRGIDTERCYLWNVLSHSSADMWGSTDEPVAQG
jgi:hypothetical protein